MGPLLSSAIQRQHLVEPVSHQVTLSTPLVGQHHCASHVGPQSSNTSTIACTATVVGLLGKLLLLLLVLQNNLQ